MKSIAVCLNGSDSSFGTDTYARRIYDHKGENYKFFQWINKDNSDYPIIPGS